MTGKFSKEEIADWLRDVKDPELTFLDIVELFIYRRAEFDDKNLCWKIFIAPTYLGCPAMDLIKKEVDAILSKKIRPPLSYSIETIFSPPWTTEWLSEETKKKMTKNGYCPPDHKTKRVPCPYCTSDDTELINYFGSTSCKSMWKCKKCLNPFEQFKCH